MKKPTLKNQLKELNDKYLRLHADFENARKLFKTCDYYYSDYNDIKVEVDDLFDNQLDNIRKFLIKNCNLSEKQINNRLKFIYNI